ncbi:Hypothetical predicted protein, partial [Olea europaea subsp. europaea]
LCERGKSRDMSHQIREQELSVHCAYKKFNFMSQKSNPYTAIVGEIGELSEILQWKREVPLELPDWKEKVKQLLCEEPSDVLLCLVRLSLTFSTKM